MSLIGIGFPAPAKTNPLKESRFGRRQLRLNGRPRKFKDMSENPQAHDDLSLVVSPVTTTTAEGVSDVD